MTIRGIFYDLDGTLRFNNPSSNITFNECARQLGLDVCEQDYMRAARWEHYYFAESPELFQDRQAFPDSHAFWENFGRRKLLEMGASPSQADEFSPLVNKYMTESYRPVDFLPEDLLGTLQTLKQRGYTLGVLSNRDESYSDYLEKLGLGGIFNLVIFAGETGFHKPEPGVFHYLLNKAGLSAEETIYVGDNYYADVVGSRSAGMLPILLDVHGVFENPDCSVIQSHTELLALLDRRQ